MSAYGSGYYVRALIIIFQNEQPCKINIEK